MESSGRDACSAAVIVVAAWIGAGGDTGSSLAPVSRGLLRSCVAKGKESSRVSSLGNAMSTSFSSSVACPEAKMWGEESKMVGETNEKASEQPTALSRRSLMSVETKATRQASPPESTDR